MGGTEGLRLLRREARATLRKLRSVSVPWHCVHRRWPFIEHNRYHMAVAPIGGQSIKRQRQGDYRSPQPVETTGFGIRHSHRFLRPDRAKRVQIECAGTRTVVGSHGSIAKCRLSSPANNLSSPANKKGRRLAPAPPSIRGEESQLFVVAPPSLQGPV